MPRMYSKLQEEIARLRAELAAAQDAPLQMAEEIACLKAELAVKDALERDIREFLEAIVSSPWSIRRTYRAGAKALLDRAKEVGYE